MNPSWLKENITSVLAIIWTVGALGIFYAIIFGNVKTTDSQITTGIFGIVMLILGYYFGASKIGNDRMKNEMDIKRIQEERTSSVSVESTEKKI